MWKFLLISLVVWFFVRRLMKFRFVVYKGGFGNQAPNYQPKKPEGSITIENKSTKDKGSKNASDGDYVDYEEVK